MDELPKLLFFVLLFVVIVLLVVVFSGKSVAQLDSPQGGPPIIESSGYPRSACDPDSGLWECRPCPPPSAEQSGMRCVCRYCINERSGKTVEKDNDLRMIYCFTGDSDS